MKTRKTTNVEWSCQLDITCPHCDEEYDFLSSDHYCNRDGWELLPEKLFGECKFETRCEHCCEDILVEVSEGL
jgi:hypothetical protein